MRIGKLYIKGLTDAVMCNKTWVLVYREVHYAVVWPHSKANAGLCSGYA